MSSESEHVEVRATVHLAGVSAGQHVLVDPSDPFVVEALAASLLVPVETPPADADRASEA